MTGAIRVMLDTAQEPAAAFEQLIAALDAALRRAGGALEGGARGTVRAGDTVVGNVVAWEAGRRAAFEWRPLAWQPDAMARVEVTAEPHAGGARVAVDVRDGPGIVGGDVELAAWFATEVAAPLLRALSPAAIGDWITDRQARRPTGPASRGIYADPLYHYPNFRVILGELDLSAADHLLEVGCGGGALLRTALESGCRAAGVDHSPDMVEVARAANRQAIEEGRLRILESSAASLPFADGTFTCAAMTGVLGFLNDPVAALREIRRVLAPGGRAVIMGSDPENRGTPAAPEPFASRLRFYEEQDLEELGRAAGFETVRAVRREMEQYAREAGVPEEHVALFAGPGARFLLLRRA